MVKFVLLLTLWSADTPVPEVYVLDSGITGQYCIEMLLESYAPDSIGVLSCEVDQAFES